MKGHEIFRAFDRHSVETAILSKYVAEYEKMWKWMIDVFSKFQGCDIKNDSINLIRAAKLLIFLNILLADAH